MAPKYKPPGPGSEHGTSRHIPAVSVVICGRNAARFLPTLLETLEKQTLPRDQFETIYVDDGSTDESVQILQRHNLIRLIAPGEHVGLPRARNLGISVARAPIVAFTDADTVPSPTWLEAGLRAMRESDADYLAGGITIPVGSRPTIAELVDATSFLDQELYTKNGFAAGANFWATSELLALTEGFNEGLEVYGGDDHDFGMRATAAGARLVYAPEAHLQHPPRTRLRDITMKSYRLGLSNAVRRRMSEGGLTGQTPTYLRTRSYYPPKRIRRLSRIVELSYSPTLLELIAMHFVRYICVQLAMVFGDWAGERRFRGAER